MVEVKVKRAGDGSPLYVEVRGHSRFASHGSDIVCAAVSILTQTIVFALEDLLKLSSPAQVEEGYMQFSMPPGLEKGQREKCSLLVETMLLGLKETARSYPGFVFYQEN